MTLRLEERAGGVRFRVRAQPRAARTEIVGAHDGALKVRLAAPPVEGEANAELVRCLAKALRVPSANVRIVRGTGGRSKTVEIAGVDADAVRRALAE